MHPRHAGLALEHRPWRALGFDSDAARADFVRALREAQEEHGRLVQASQQRAGAARARLEVASIERRDALSDRIGE